MVSSYKKGDKKIYKHTVSKEDVARFETGMVHPIYATFSLARDAEWSGRLFVLDMKEEDEEGIGTGLTIEHLAPAFVDEEVVITSTFEDLQKNELTTSFTATVGDRIIAKGIQKQKIIKKEKLKIILNP